jgi:hypothetical protein
MALSNRDYVKAANAIRAKEKIEIGGKTHYIDRRDRYIIALFMRDHFQASDKLFDGLAFLTMCGF